MQVSASLDRLVRQAELVSRLESLFFSKLLTKAPPRLIALCQRSALLRTSRYQLQFITRPNDARDTQLPEDLKINIFKLAAQRRDRNQNIKKEKCENNFNLFKNSMERRCETVDGDEDLYKSILRPHSVAVARNRIFPDNVEDSKILKNTNSCPCRNDSKELMKNMNELCVKMDKLSTLVTRKLNTTTEELCRIKMQLDHREPQ